MNLSSNLKKRLASATLGLALLAGTTLATTGIVPVKISGVESQQKANAQNANRGNCYRKNPSWGCYFPGNSGMYAGVTKIVHTGGSGADVQFLKITYSTYNGVTTENAQWSGKCIMGQPQYGQYPICTNPFGNGSNVRVWVSPHNNLQTTFFDLYY
jgi:hypothetical protein